MKSVKPKLKTQNLNHRENALLEIGLEEVPSRFMPAILSDLREKAIKELQAENIAFKALATLGTPRRIVLYIEGMLQKQEDIKKEVRGPSKEIAFNSGKPTKAAEGFAAGQGVKVSDLIIKKMGDKEFIFANVNIKGKETNVILEQLFPKIIKALYLPISMRWGAVDFRFIRPIHWIFAVCGSSTLQFEIGGIKTSNKTFGHRNAGSKPVIINTIKGIELSAFKKALVSVQVILDQDERRDKIVSQVNAAAKKLKGEALLDKDLLEEVNYLVEWPLEVTGTFNKEFLSLPKDVLITSMKKNQKYFAVVDANEKLMPVFVNITNGIKAEDIKNVVLGNERVLTARLKDAKFFFDEDRKRSMGDLVQGLSKVAFIEKLGSMLEKVERIGSLSAWIAHELKLPDGRKEAIKNISQLCKADLLTHMVYEFGSLQGIMGRDYSLLEGKPKDIAVGIFEHYLPRFAGDKLPSSTEGAVVGIADKIDTIVGCFAIGLVPTGSEDPFALRRNAQGIVNILLAKKISLPLELLIEKSYKCYEKIFLSDIFTSQKFKFNEVQKVIPEVMAFLAARVKGQMLDIGIKYDVADATLASFDDALDAAEKAAVISTNLGQEWLKGIVFTADRVKRLAMNATRENVIEADFVCDEEKRLYELYMQVNAEVSEKIEKDDYVSALKALSKMTKPIDDFFVKVMVMDKDQKLKANRLSLLKTIDRVYLELADFSKIVM